MCQSGSCSRKVPPGAAIPRPGLSPRHPSQVPGMRCVKEKQRLGKYLHRWVPDPVSPGFCLFIFPKSLYTSEDEGPTSEDVREPCWGSDSVPREAPAMATCPLRVVPITHGASAAGACAPLFRWPMLRETQKPPFSPKRHTAQGVDF